MLFQMTNLGFIEDNRFPFRENEGTQAVLVGESDAANMWHFLHNQLMKNQLTPAAF